jgi:hypothetical protein
MAALLSVSLFLIGCDPGTGAAGSDGRIGDGHVGVSASVAGLQAMIDRYDGKSAELVLDGVTVTGSPGVVDFKTVKAYVVGTLTLSPGVAINAAKATVCRRRDGFGGPTNVIVGDSEVFTLERVTGAKVATPVTDLSEDLETAMLWR